MQLESERQQEAEKAAKVHDEMREAHTKLKRLDKDLKHLTTHQVSSLPAVHLCTSLLYLVVELIFYTSQH